jgi:hypothetical protein
MVISGGQTDDAGAALFLYHKDNNSRHGEFLLQAHDGTNVMHLIGYADGTLTWGGKDVLVVESWRSEDGMYWYRKYSDGWIEQGGYASSSNQEVKFTYPIPFPSREYSLQVTARAIGDSRNANGGVTGTTPSGCTFNSMIGKSSAAEFYACGFVE